MHDVSDEIWEELAAHALATEGRRTGGARRAVVYLLAGQDCCLSAQEIADRIRAQGKRVGVASVYRALDLLHGHGLVQRVEVGEGGARFEAVVPGGEHHHHAVCERCGRLTPFEDAGLERAIGRLSDRLGHRVDAHDVLIRGECAGCTRSR
ncbi:MAG: Fur family transcriptional regulator [Solirubrobacterales bacterium]